MEIHQFLPSLSDGDAIGLHTLQVRGALRGRYGSEIFYERADPHLAHEGRYYSEYAELPSASSGENLVLFHFSIGSQVADFLIERREPLVLYYHNVTPPDFFLPYDPEHARLLEEGLRQMKTLSERVSLALTPSEFSRLELERAGYPKTSVVPLLVDWTRFDAAPDEATLDSIRRSKIDGPDMLFVGRIAPNKRHEDLIKLLEIYRRHVGSSGRLFIVGSHHHTTFAYSSALSSFIRELGLAGRAHVVGPVSFSELLAYYRACDVFVSMSEHEGFGVPLLEAMYVGLPVLAFGATAIAETIGDAGVVLYEKDLLAFALAVDRIHRDEPYRRELIESGRRRVAEYSLQRVSGLLLECIAGVA